MGFSINSGINIFDKQWTDKSVGIAVYCGIISKETVFMGVLT